MPRSVRRLNPSFGNSVEKQMRMILRMNIQNSHKDTTFFLYVQIYLHFCIFFFLNNIFLSYLLLVSIIFYTFAVAKDIVLCTEYLMTTFPR